MTSLQRGPYQLLHQLGEGGMGTVWLATHCQTGEHTAVKILTDRDARIKLRFRREIRILQQLQHPGIVQFVKSGTEDDGELWYAMKLLRGKPLSWHLKRLAERWPTSGEVGQMSTLDAGHSAHWTDRLDEVDALLSSASPEHPPRHTPRLRTASLTEQASRHSVKELRAALATTLLSTSSTTRPTQPDPDSSFPLDEEPERRPRPWPDADLSRMLAWLTQLCTTLAHVHGEGIVHCDIKPENVVITEDGDAILVDFGIAERFGARVEQDVLEGAGIQAGTAFYISPEQIRGEPVDARTDLYALGCMLYEVLTGAPPFVTGTPMSVLLKHLSKTPAPVRTHHPHMPAELDMLCAMLLSKTPEARPGHALGVARQLTPHAGQIRSWHPTPEPARPYLYRARLTGRDALIEALDQSLLASAEGQTLSVTLGGESGVGKSSIAAEIIGRARHRDFMAMSARCEPVENTHTEELFSGAPLHAFEPLLRQIVDTCTACDEATMRRVLWPHAHHLQTYSKALQECSFDQVPLKRQTGSRNTAKRAQKLIFSSLYAIIENYIAERPLLMLFDDLHAADELSLQALEWIAWRARTQQKRWLVLGFYASDERLDRLDTLLGHKDWVHHRIERLGERAIARLCAQMLGVSSPNKALIAHVHAQTQGNPFFVAEYLKLAMEQGQLRMDELGRWHLDEELSVEELATPSSVSAIVDSRLARLPEQARELCSVASVLGHTITLEALGALLDGWRTRKVEASLTLLVQREILSDELTHTYQFVHDRLRESAYNALEVESRAKLHRKAARWLGRAHASPAVIATHYERGQRPARAGKFYVLAAEQAASQFAFGQAMELYERAWPLIDELDALERRMRMVEEILLPTRRLDEAEAQLEIILKGARQHELATLRARALTLLGRTCMHQGRLARAERMLNEAASRFDALASGQGLADTRYQLAHLKLQSVELEEARAIADDARQRYLRIKDRKGQAKASLLLGEVCWRLGRLREAESTFEQALSLHQKLESGSGQAEAQTWLAQLYCEQQRFKAMQRHLMPALAVYTQMDDPSGLAQIAILEARQALATSHTEAAITHLQRALAELARTHDPHHQVIALTELARAHMLAGDEASASMAIEQAKQFNESPLTQSTLFELETSFAELTSEPD